VSPELFPELFEGTDPDVAKADRVAMILERKGEPVRMRQVGRPDFVRRRSCELYIIVDENAVMKYGHPGRPQDFPLRIEARPPENNVIGLPFARSPAGVDQRRILAVNGSSHAVGIGLVLVGI